MPEQIDELFVRLGLEQDQQQFQQAQNNFDSLRSAALQFGAVIGAGFGINELTFDLSRAVNEMNKLAGEFRGLDVDPAFVSDLRGAFTLIDEDAGEADSTIRQLADLIEQTEWGNIPEDAIARGFDPNTLRNVDNAREALERINEQVEGMDPKRAREMLSALGFGSGQIRMIRDFDISEQMSQARNLRPLTDEMSDAAKEFQHGFHELSLALDGLKRELGETFVGDLGEGMSRMADLLAENRDAIQNFADEATPILGGMATSLGILVGIRSARAGLGVLSKIPGATLLAGGVAGYAYQQVRESMGEEGLSEEEQRRLEQTAGVGAGQTMRGPPENQDMFAEPGSGRFWAPQRQQGPDLGPLYDATPNRGGNSYEINVDARGATDPEQVRENARRGAEEALQESSETTIEDFKTDVQ